MAKKKSKASKTARRTTGKTPRPPQPKAQRKPVKVPAGTGTHRGAAGRRVSWLDDDNVPQLDAQLQKLSHFVAAMADGRIDHDELAAQEKRLVAAMKTVEPSLSDRDHPRVTELLVELTAYNVMQVLHGLANERLARSFG